MHSACPQLVHPGHQKSEPCTVLALDMNTPGITLNYRLRKKMCLAHTPLQQALMFHQTAC